MLVQACVRQHAKILAVYRLAKIFGVVFLFATPYAGLHCWNRVDRHLRATSRGEYGLGDVFRTLGRILLSRWSLPQRMQALARKLDSLAYWNRVVKETTEAHWLPSDPPSYVEEVAARVIIELGGRPNSAAQWKLARKLAFRLCDSDGHRPSHTRRDVPLIMAAIEVPVYNEEAEEVYARWGTGSGLPDGLLDRLLGVRPNDA